MCWNDAFLLPKVLPILRPHFDLFVVGYTHSADGTLDILFKHSPIVEILPKSYNWSYMRNRIINVAEDKGCTHMLMIDSDECMLESDLRQVREELERNGNARATMYPRWEFCDDFQHYDPSLAPDYQARGFMLNEGYAYSGKTHEQLTLNGALCYQNGLCHASKLHIFHAGKVKDTRYVALKYLNYDRLRNGLEPVAELPEAYDIPATWAVGTKAKFEGPTPW